MSGEILTRWAVAWETAVSADAIGADGRLSAPVLRRLFADGRRAYFERCPSLREELHGDRIRLQEEALRVDPTEPLGSVRSVLVAVSVTELRPTSFDMALRVRSLGDDGSLVANGRCTLVFMDATAGTPVRMTEAVRRDIIAVEAGASSYC